MGFRKLTDKNNINKILNKPPPTATSGEKLVIYHIEEYLKSIFNFGSC